MFVEEQIGTSRGLPETPVAPAARERLLAAASGAVAASAYAGALGVATGADPDLQHLEERLPFNSPALGGLALSVAVGVPYTARAADTRLYAGIGLLTWGLAIAGSPAGFASAGREA